ncbi:MAG: OmpA family protein [Bradymonadaceae bacterium]|nr:OmpA family protein [Lujinxingiaceae bacterium]
MKFFKPYTAPFCALAMLVATASTAVAQESDAPAQDEARVEQLVNERNKESAHGSNEWKPSYGFGVEGGYFYTMLDRWNTHLLSPNNAPFFDTAGVFNLDLALEASFLESTRLTLFAGMATPFSDDPSLRATYFGLEPAFAFREGNWEVALGIGAALGWITAESGGSSATANAIVLRPFVEGRRYLNSWSALYVRLGFNQWYAHGIESDNFELTRLDGQALRPNDLHEGGLYGAIGVRFGHYPEHVRYIGDSDGDGFYDDVDDCPQVAEDFDGFEDHDGCPELDNDGDGILNSDDRCPNEAGLASNHGCPMFDTDGDGILDAHDPCLDTPEDFDGFEDHDGCPELDRDGDGIADIDDHCPDVAGVIERQGCPFQRVEVTLKNIVINDVVNFEYDKAVILADSFDLLNEVAGVINANARIRKIEVQGHTDHAGTPKYNQTLSESRARAVREYLIGQNVDPARLSSKGYGQSMPLVPVAAGAKETAEDAATNRRVEFLIVEQDEVRKVVREDQVPDDAAKIQSVDGQ